MTNPTNRPTLYNVLRQALREAQEMRRLDSRSPQMLIQFHAPKPEELPYRDEPSAQIPPPRFHFP